MTESATTNHRNVRDIASAPSTTAADRESELRAEQLTLLSVPIDTRAQQLPTTARPTRSVHARFRLNQQTRERGLAHVAEIRRQLEEAKAARESATTKRLPPRRPQAA